MLRLLTTPYAVGYGPSALQESGISAGATFTPVTKGELIDLTDIKVDGYMDVEGYCDGFVNVQTLDEAGRTKETYFWMDDGMGGAGEFYGWYPTGGDTPIAKGVVTIQPGEGLWAFCQRDGFSFQSSGEVPTATDVIVTLQESGLTVVNPTPVSVDLTDTYITGYMEVEGYCDGFVNVQTLDEAGRTQETYFWMDDGMGGEGEFYGWYPTGGDTPIAKGVVTVLPGQGLWSFSQRDGFYFNWPKVDVK